jgi:hypothetical protein
LEETIERLLDINSEKVGENRASVIVPEGPETSNETAPEMNHAAQRLREEVNLFLQEKE